MSVFFRPVLNRPDAHTTAISTFACAMCDGCGAQSYPNSSKWYRCNTCENYDLCGTCWASKHAEHQEGKHTFTDMSTVLRNTCGFPIIENQGEWYGSEPYETCTCNGCGSIVRNHRFYHCNECPRPGYDLCVECMITKDLWRTHSGPDGAAHTFTNAMPIHMRGMLGVLALGHLLSQMQS
ncbi:hypothetical protein STCU_11832 [Strigomonas culicis]|uniref:ZZ-type domain-containing protein n=1 Tax=Strigomonas culicis TaxID=28005 RepID=S9TFI1_9TRYP|nr:hypothetical protein STCU_11832 [Strigomonas culicis]|eukprot:EPY15689.1 hypothetical protein STCU_11832 [Strigomonas culicis]